MLSDLGHVSDARDILFQRDLEIAKNSLALVPRRKYGTWGEQILLLSKKFFSWRTLNLFAGFTYGLKFIGDKIIRHFTGYGHKPMRAAVWSVMFLLVGIFIFNEANQFGYLQSAQEEVNIALAEQAASISPDDEAFISEVRGTGLTPIIQSKDDLADKLYQPIRMQPFIYALDVFLPVVNLHQQDYWIPKSPDFDIATKTYLQRWPSMSVEAGNQCPVQLVAWHFDFDCSQTHHDLAQVLENSLRNGLARHYYWFLILMGWVLSTVVIAGFSGVLARDR